MKKAIYKLHFDCGRMGDLNGSFVATKLQMETLITNEINVYFGEVLGKHSEVYGPIEWHDITEVSDDETTVRMFEENNLSSGHDPFEYYSINYTNETITDLDDKIIEEIVDHIIETENLKVEEDVQ